MMLQLVQREREQRRECFRRRRPGGEVFGLEMADGPVARVGPLHEQQGRTVAALRVRRLVHERAHRVGSPVGAAERGGALVHAPVAAERVVRQLRRRDSRSTLPSRNATLAGRSARRRMRYGYHWVPNGTYTRTLNRWRRSASCRSRRTPYSIWNSKRAGG